MSKINDSLYESSSHEWETPPEFIGKVLNLLEIDKFDIDMCCESQNIPAKVYLTRNGAFEADQKISELSGLEFNLNGNVWMNPPYGNLLKKFVERVYVQTRNKGVNVIALLPARIETSYYHRFVLTAGFIIFIEGKMEFWKEGKPGGGKSPSSLMLVHWGDKTQELIMNWWKMPKKDRIKGTLLV